MIDSIAGAGSPLASTVAAPFSARTQPEFFCNQIFRNHGLNG
jgi:hypothetical protein